MFARSKYWWSTRSGPADGFDGAVAVAIVPEGPPLGQERLVDSLVQAARFGVGVIGHDGVEGVVDLQADAHVDGVGLIRMDASCYVLEHPDQLLGFCVRETSLCEFSTDGGLGWSCQLGYDHTAILPFFRTT